MGCFCYFGMARVKAVSLFSGGLDSILATKLIQSQGIEVVAFNVKSPFCALNKEGLSEAEESAKQINVPLVTVDAGTEYIKMVKSPKHGYGKNINPCVDCKIFFFKLAKKYAKEIDADFLFTGEVLGERPMSQHLPQLNIIEEESGLKGKLLRPLSAKLLPETAAERKGLVDRSKLLDISGRSRKPQIKLAAEFGVKTFPSPAGGCLLTCKEYAEKLADLYEHKKNVSASDVALLSIGRHFRLGKNKIIVGRNQAENKLLCENKASTDLYFELPDVVGPTTLLQGPKTKKAIEFAAGITVYYSDARTQKASVNFGRETLNKIMVATTPNENEIEKLRIGSQT
jgi:tRNA-uridine 2-sulfurtransferase